MVQDGNETGLFVIKLLSMIIMFLMIMITGNLPLRWERFRKSTTIISLASAFSGGLFLAVGVLHLLPEAAESFEHGLDTEFPWAHFIAVICFAFILFIEKVLFASFVHGDHDHAHGDEEGGHAHIPLIPSKEKEKDTNGINTDDPDDAEQKRAQRKSSLVHQMAKEAKRSTLIENEPKLNKLTPYILQIAIGIHATFEGLAIGIASNYAGCLGIALAVVCHKWAEGLTLGLAFFKADIDLKMSTIMIAIQAIMNPIGILIGWVLSGQGHVVTGIFQAISAGTFLYIASGEVIVNEFNLKRHRYLKFFLFCIAILFITSLFFLEQLAGGHDHDHDHDH